MGLAQLKILPEAIKLGVLIPFAVLHMGEKLRLDFLWAGYCLMGAVDLVFRGGMGPKG